MQGTEQDARTALTPRERDILTLRGFRGGSVSTFAQIGRVFGISRARAHAIHSNAVRKLTREADPARH